MSFWSKSDAMSVVEAALRGRSWKFQRAQPDLIATGVTTSADRAYFITIRHVPDRQTLLFLFNPVGPVGARTPVSAESLATYAVHAGAGHDAEQIRAVCQTLMDMNFTTLLGNFERDAEDGEIRFRITLPYRDGAVSEAQVNWCLEVALPTLDRALSKIEQTLQVVRV